MKINKIILNIIILSVIALILSGCGGGGYVTPPYPDSEPLETIIPDTTKVVEEETIQEIASITEDQSTIIFKKSTPQLEELAPGDIIAMGVTENTPEGLLRKVKNITKGGKGSSEIIVETEFATLEEAIEQGEFNFDIPLQIKNIKEPFSCIEGVKLITDQSKLKDFSHEFNYEIDLIAYDGDGNPNTVKDNIVTKGFIFFDYNIIFTAEIESHKLKNFVFKNIVELETDISVGVGGKISVNILGKSLLPEPISLGAYTIMLGAIPVVLSPSIDIKWGLNGELYGELSIGVTRTDTFTAGLEWSNGTAQPIADHSIDYNYNAPSTSLGGQVEFSIGPELSCKIYKVLGPYCDTSLYAKLSADILGDPWWKLVGGVDVGVGAKLEIFTKTYIDVFLKVINFSISIAQADGPFGGINHAPVISSLIANPSSLNTNLTTTITCTASDEDVGDTLTYIWTKTGGTFEGNITGSSVTWRAPSTEGNYSVECEVSDGEKSDSKSVNISVGEVNHAPDITSTAITSATKDEPYSYDVNATDSDGDTLTYSLTTSPTGMTINSTTGLISWTPTSTGDYEVTVRVSDGSLFDTQSFTIHVEETPPVNQAPNITSTSITSATVDQAYTYNVDATDPDGDTLTYSLTTSPTGMTINSTTGLISWTPTSTGDYNVTVKVSDGELFDTQSFIITVEENGTYALRDIGPAGGYIFYDKGYYSSGWRYLEAAPVSTEWTDKQWGSYGTSIGGTETGIGTGQSNTTIIVTWLNSHSETNRAAQLCDALVYGGYSDWFLPSKDELNLMYTNLKVYGVGGFYINYELIGYYSSSETPGGIGVYTQQFDDGSMIPSPKDHLGWVRAVRAF
jgi:hypothetical protein